MKSTTGRYVTRTVLAATVLCSLSRADAVQFQGLGRAPGGPLGGYNTVSGISADGQVVVGTMTRPSDLKHEAFRWSNGVWTPLGLTFDGMQTYARAVSADGKVIVGISEAGGGGYGRPVCWQNDVLTTLPLAEDDTSGEALAVSADGRTIVGSSGSKACVWRDGQLTVLQCLDPGLSCGAYGVSPDGQSVVGTTEEGWWRECSDEIHACYWGAGGGVAVLYPDPSDSSNSCSNSYAQAVSGNGVATGSGPLAPAPGARGLAISLDGTIVVGRHVLPGQLTDAYAFIWDASQGERNIQDMLGRDYGIDLTLTGWQLTEATGISADGSIVIGNGLHTGGGADEGWILRLNSSTLYAVTTEVVGQGSIQRDFTGQGVAPGTQIVLVAQAADGWRFVRWEGNSSGTEPALTLTVTADTTVRAVFEQEQPVSPTVPIAGSCGVGMAPTLFAACLGFLSFRLSKRWR